MEYITLTKDDPEFESYLLGTFSREMRALPIETYHVDTPRERVTFHLVPLEKVTKPAWWKVYFLSARPEFLPLTLGPSVAAWLNQREWIGDWNRWPSWFALAGVFFLHTSAFIYNDVQDHMRGQDRQNRRRGSQVIQQGWTTAVAMKRWAAVNFLLAVAFGVPAFLNAPLQLAAVCFAAFLSLVVLSRASLSRYGLADLAIFFLFGPLLTSGIALASFGASNWRDTILGIAFGAMTLWVFHTRQLGSLFRTRSETSRTLIGYCDFDQAKKICLVEGALLLLIQPLVAVGLSVPLKLMVVLPFVCVPTIFFMGRQFRAASPLSSSLMNSNSLALVSHLTWTAWWIVALGVSWL